MPHWKTLTSRPYIGSWDIPEGKELRGVIERVEGAELFNPDSKTTQKKPVLYFKNKKKGFVANTTNCKTISTLVGTTDYTKWIGQEIVIYVTKTLVQGDNGPEQVPCLRVRPTTTKAKK